VVSPVILSAAKNDIPLAGSFPKKPTSEGSLHQGAVGWGYPGM